MGFDVVGWAFEALAWLFLGSFSVPIKHPPVMAVHGDPFVFQSVKTLVFFSCTWLVLLWAPFAWTPWGLLSGFFWVLSGTLAVVAVQNAGMAVGAGKTTRVVGTWCLLLTRRAFQGVVQGTIVLVSFTWSLVIFREPMWSYSLTALAVSVLIAGVMGMSYALRPEPAPSLEVPLQPVGSASTAEQEIDVAEPASAHMVQMGRIKLPRYVFGIVVAMVSGSFAGSGVAPLKLAARYSGVSGGIEYLVSFGTGALATNAALWLLYVPLRFALRADRVVPVLHLRVIAVPAMITGALFALGNFCMIEAVLHLGLGVGQGCAQFSIAVAGLWGIFYYRETKRPLRIVQWFVCAVMALAAILGLSLLQFYGSVNATINNATSTS